MLVETYEVTETNPETGLSEFTPEALALIEQLGLEGQKELMTERRVGDETVTTICPYRQMSATEQRVYEFLLPTKMNLAAYNRGPVPLRVLQVAALATREEWFRDLVVWCPASEQDKDPLLVGVNKGEKPHLLARWGDELAPFEELAAKAQHQWIERSRARLQQRLATVESAAVSHFGGEWVFGYD